MSSNKIEEDHHHLTFFTSHMFPQEESNITHMTPQQQAGNEKKPRRSRRVRKVSEDGNNEDAAMRKRKLSEEQVSLLESSFEHDHKLESERKERLASELGLDPRQVAVWFQNRRARWKSKKLEEEYSKLKSLHDIVLLQKYELQSQVLRMKEQLSESEDEIRSLLERVGSRQSPSSSSFSMDAMGIPPFMVMEGYEYETERLQNVLYISDNLWGQSM